MIGARLTGDVSSVTGQGGLVTLVEGRTFCLSTAGCDVAGAPPQGLFVLDTRVLSKWELLVNGDTVEGLAVDAREPYSADFVGRSPPPAVRETQRSR